MLVCSICQSGEFSRHSIFEPGFQLSHMESCACDHSRPDFQADRSLTVDHLGRTYQEVLPGVFLHRRDLEPADDINI